ncbi:MAG TPA: DUF3048 domain-containing protein [Acidimicrobiia bacterium]|nr:DUF3048 domain-containing protein [Acidimicrobiia bacterium]
MSLRRTSVAVMGLAALLTAACGGGGVEPKPVAAVTPDTQVSEGTVTTEGAPLAPLTGLPDASGATKNRPSLAVKIDNAPEARPQSGLDVADVVYEEVVEGGVTRFIAVFHSAAPATAGPVRSVRPMDPDILAAYHGLFAYSGGIPAFVSLMRKAPVQDVNVDVATDGYSWDKSRRAPHNTFISPEKLWSKAKGDNAAPPQPMFEFRPAGEAFGDAPATHLSMTYSPRASAAYDWDAASATYKRGENGTPHTAASGAQIAPHNLVIQFVTTKTLSYKDQSGSNVVESIVVGSGDAWILSNGRITKGRWSKSSESAPTKYTDAAGNPVKLTPGRTWVHFAPVGTPVTTR